MLHIRDYPFDTFDKTSWIFCEIPRPNLIRDVTFNHAKFVTLSNEL